MRILCIGDSNTWGYNPVNGQRFSNRWPKVLAKLMPENEIIEEGLNGRTITSIDPVFNERCGIKGLKMLLMSHKPIDCVIIMLGTNELKSIFNKKANDIAEGIKQLLEIIINKDMWERFNIPKILVVSPILIRDELLEIPAIFEGFDENSVIQSKQLAQEISKICNKYNVEFMNAADFAMASLVDCIHMDEENHIKLAKAIKQKLINI